MPRFRCCFLNDDAQVLRVEEFNCQDDRDASRSAASLMVKIGRFSGYELWREGRKVDDYRPAKLRGGSHPRCDELEAENIIETLTQKL